MSEKYPLKYHERSCFSCRYYYFQKQQVGGTVTANCGFKRRLLSFAGSGYSGYCDLSRYCDAWKQRPGTWKAIYLQIIKNKEEDEREMKKWLKEEVGSE